MLTIAIRRTFVQHGRRSLNFHRAVSTLDSNPHIYVFRDPSVTSSTSSLLSLLPTDPPTSSLAIGTTTQIPPTSFSLKENRKFLSILHAVIAENAASDPIVQSQAAALASSSGSILLQPRRRTEEGSFGGSSDQGGAGGGGRGGWVHVSDDRHPPDYGRIAEPEDIFGSVEVDARGNFVDGHGRYQESGTYRICTKEGVLGLSDHLRQKLVERLQVEEAAEKNKK